MQDFRESSAKIPFFTKEERFHVEKYTTTSPGESAVTCSQTIIHKQKSNKVQQWSFPPNEYRISHVCTQYIQIVDE